MIVLIILRNSHVCLQAAFNNFYSCQFYEKVSCGCSLILTNLYVWDFDVVFLSHAFPSKGIPTYTSQHGCILEGK